MVHRLPRSPATGTSATSRRPKALNTAGPVVVEAYVDPYEPPMPANITLDQASKFAESLVRGEPNRSKIALTVLEDKVKELV